MFEFEKDINDTVENYKELLTLTNELVIDNDQGYIFTAEKTVQGSMLRVGIVGTYGRVRCTRAMIVETPIIFSHLVPLSRRDEALVELKEVIMFKIMGDLC